MTTYRQCERCNFIRPHSVSRCPNCACDDYIINEDEPLGQWQFIVSLADALREALARNEELSRKLTAAMSAINMLKV